MIPNIFNTENDEIINHKNKKTNSKKNSNRYFDYSEIDRKKDIFNFGKDLYKESEERYQIKDYEELTKNYQNNPIFDNKEAIKPNALCMKSLSDIAFKKNEKGKESENEEKSEDFEEKTTDRINERFNMENKKKDTMIGENIHDTAKLILGECNLYSSKSKFNDGFHKSRAGKTMITKGLSVNEFLKKHSLDV